MNVEYLVFLGLLTQIQPAGALSQPAVHEIQEGIFRDKGQVTFGPWG